MDLDVQYFISHFYFNDIENLILRMSYFVVFFLM